MPNAKALTDEQVQSFFEKGYFVVKSCLDLNTARRWIDEAFNRLGYKQDDPNTWAKDIIWMSHKNERVVRELAPNAWEAILEAVGGEERLETQVMQTPENLYPVNSFKWSDAFIINFRRGADQPWQPPSPEVSGWHKDGGYFRHFLDSPEQGLLTLVLWSDMHHQGGGTFVAPDSVRLMARYLADHPEGIPTGGFDFEALINQCTHFEELTGSAGDVFILHPFILHASSQNVLGRPRIITNPPIVLKEPMHFNRSNPDDYSLLERATLHYLGLERLDFRPTAAREAAWRPI